MQDIQTRPRDTGEIKAKLKSYGALQRRIDLLITRLENLMEEIDTLPTANFSGMPSGRGQKRPTKAERYTEKKDELEQKISKLTRQERHLRKELEDMINLLADPDEQGVLEMRYIDTQGWEPIAFSLFGMLDEYEDNPERYMKRTFRVHGEALQHLAAVFPPGSTTSLP